MAILLVSVTASCQIHNYGIRSGWLLITQVELNYPVVSYTTWQLSNQSNNPCLAWTGSLATPNIRMTGCHSSNTQQQFALGVAPFRLQGFAVGAGQSQLLWLDRRTSGAGLILNNAVLNDQQQLVRGPTMLSTGSVKDYAAQATSDGQVIVVWTETSPENDTVSALYLSVIDAAGRPLIPLMIASQALYPSISRDTQGTFYISWLGKPQGNLYPFHLLTLSDISKIQAQPSWPSKVITMVSSSPEHPIIGLTSLADGVYLYLVEQSLVAGQELTKQLHISVIPLTSPSKLVVLSVNDAAQVAYVSAPTMSNGQFTLPLVRHTPHATTVTLLHIADSWSALPEEQVTDWVSSADGMIYEAAFQHDVLSWSVLKGNGSTQLVMAARTR